MKIRTETIKAFKRQRPISCLTSYDSMTAEIFDRAGIDLILVGDSAANTVLGKPTTLPVTLDEMITFGAAVSGVVEKAMVVIDMPFGSYEISPEEALRNSIEVMKKTGADAVKLEGGNRIDTIRLLIENGIPVMGHLGFTPQSVNQVGGFKVQGRGDQSAEIITQAKNLEGAGVFSIVLEMVPADLAAEITEAISIPTIGIGAGNQTDGQILVWQDFAGLSEKLPKFVKTYAQIREQLESATEAFISDVQSREFPSSENSFD